MSDKIIDTILSEQIKTLAIIGMEKNTGKTVTLNTILTEAVARNLSVAVVSYGRDGEEVDAITRHKKPRIFIPSGALFVTAEDAINKSDFNARLETTLDHHTLLGQVGLYRNTGQGGYCELVGINSSSQILNLKQVIGNRQDVDLLLIDGALDRKSSAMPNISEGFVMATGANIADSEELVVEKTNHELKKLTTAKVKDENLLNQAKQLQERGVTALITDQNQVIELAEGCSFSAHEYICSQLLEYRDSLAALVISGALTDSLVEKILFQIKLSQGRIIVKDGTKIFVKARNQNLLANRGIELQVLDSITLVAVTVNPWSTRGVFLSSEKMIAGLQEFTEVPIFDLLSTKYTNREMM